MTRDVPNPFVELLGFELVEVGGGRAQIIASIRDDLRNSWGVMHGGVTMTLLDVTMASAALSHGQTGQADESGSRGIVTVEMKTSFMRPGIGRLRAEGRVLHRTVSMAFCEGSVYDEDSVIVAHATGTFRFLKGLPAGGRKIQRLNAPG